jgi:hypothetical protein
MYNFKSSRREGKLSKVRQKGKKKIGKVELVRVKHDSKQI